MGLEVSHTWGSTPGRLSGVGGRGAGRRGKTRHSEVEGERERRIVACSFWRMSLPSRGTRRGNYEERVGEGETIQAASKGKGHPRRGGGPIDPHDSDW